MDDSLKEVYFHQYCPNCINAAKLETEDPCYDCLYESVNTYSHKPVNYIDKEESKNG